MNVEILMNAELKRKLLQLCKDSVAENINMIEQRLASIKESRDGETKSSAGDKYETGRAMMQMEFEKAETQLIRQDELLLQLKSLKIEKQSSNVIRGSLVETDQGIYFVSIGLGKITFENQIFYCLSARSPVGRLLIGKKIGDLILFNKKIINILGIY